MRGWIAALALVTAIGCGGRAVPVAPPLAADCSGLPQAPDRHVATLLPGAGGSECVALVEEQVSPIRTVPAAWVRRGGRWSPVVLPPGDYENAGWQHAAVDGGVVYGLLDNVIEDPGWELIVMASADGGRTWVERGRFRKPYYYSFARSLSVDGDRATIAVELFDDLGSGVEEGTYYYWTRDGGHSWRGPAFEESGKHAEATGGRWLVSRVDDDNVATYLSRGGVIRAVRMPWVESTTVHPLSAWGERPTRAWVVARESEWCECSEPPEQVAIYRLDGERWSRTVIGGHGPPP